jgi:hypothetical protein
MSLDFRSGDAFCRRSRHIVDIFEVAPEALVVAQCGVANGTRGQSQVHTGMLGIRLLRPKLFIADVAHVGSCKTTPVLHFSTSHTTLQHSILCKFLIITYVPLIYYANCLVLNMPFADFVEAS